MDFDAYLRLAWDEHATHPHAVAQRLDQGAALVADEAQLGRLAELAHHVQGAHLGDWDAATGFLVHLASHPSHLPAGASGATLRRLRASLALSANDAVDLSASSPSDRVRVHATAAANLAEHDTPRALRLLQKAVALADEVDLPPTDPAHRALAASANNLALALEEKPARSAEERALMILAAETARRHWELAGTWLETERAEYRLCKSWLQAGEPQTARRHAQACLGIVAAHGDVPLERFFAWEALGLAERAAGDLAGHARALAGARRAYAELDPADRSWCDEPLGRLAGNAM